jgi:hypothetical protein
MKMGVAIRRVVASTVLSTLWLTGCGGGDEVRVIEDASPTIIAGDGVPADAEGHDGAFYLDKQSLMFYGPRTNGQWPQPPVSLVGPAGADGQDGVDGQDGIDGMDGADGQDGIDGASVLSGNGAPSNALGADGDFYVDVASATFYGPKLAGVWPASGIGLVGPAGPAGPASGSGFLFQAGIPSGIGNGSGSYYLNPNGITASRYPVLLPQACIQARLRVATFATPSPGNSMSFTVLHTPGPDLLPAGAVSVGGLTCTISETVRSCDVQANVNLQERDAIEVQVTGTQAIGAMSPTGSWSIVFSCE